MQKKVGIPKTNRQGFRSKYVEVKYMWAIMAVKISKMVLFREIYMKPPVLIYNFILTNNHPR